MGSDTTQWRVRPLALKTNVDVACAVGVMKVSPAVEFIADDLGKAFLLSCRRRYCQGFGEKAQNGVFR
jgi:hypothetical protein